MSDQLELKLPRRRVLLLEANTIEEAICNDTMQAIASESLYVFNGESFTLTDWFSGNDIPSCQGWYEVTCDLWRGVSHMMFWNPGSNSFRFPSMEVLWQEDFKHRSVSWRGLTRPPRHGYSYDVPGCEQIAATSRARRQLVGV